MNMNFPQQAAERPGAPNLKTREIRWFFAGETPGLKSPFEGLSEDQFALESRTDRYLRVPGREDLGIKIRQGRLEVKYRTRTPEGFEAAPGVRGMLECWEKLGFELSPGGVPGMLPENFEASWVEVHKQRWVTSVRMAEDLWQYTPPWKRGTDSVQLEYTRVGLEGLSWDTFGLEWPYGQPPDLAKAILREWALPHRLEEKDSMGYPAFLLQHPGPS